MEAEPLAVVPTKGVRISERDAGSGAEPGIARDERLRGIADLRGHAAKGMIVNSAYQLAIVGSSALRGLVVAAFLTRADYGVWGLLGLAMWTALGLKNQFGASDKYIQQSEPDQELAFQQAFTVELIFAAAVAPTAVVTVAAFAVISGHLVILVPGLVLLLVLPAIVLQFPLSAFYRRMDYRRQRTLQVIDPVVTAVVTVGLAIAGAGYWSFVGGALAGSWSGAIVAVRASPYRLAWRYHFGVLRSYVRFSAPLLVAGLSGMALFQVIYLVGSDALGLAALGAFTLAGNFLQFTDQADAIVTQTLYPAVCTARDRLGVLAEVFVKSNRLSLMWAVPFGIGLSLFCSDLVRFVIGDKWLPAVPLLEIMGVVTALHHVGYNWGAFFMARGQTRPIAFVAAVPLLVFIAIGIPLMYSGGLTGLGVAFAIGVGVGQVMRTVLLARFFEGFRLQRHLLRAFAPTAVAAAPILLLRALSGVERSLAAAVAVFALYVAVTVVATYVFERPLLAEALGYLIRRRPQLA